MLRAAEPSNKTTAIALLVSAVVAGAGLVMLARPRREPSWRPYGPGGVVTGKRR